MTHTYGPSPETLDHLVNLLAHVRPGWPSHIVKAVLQAHVHQVELGDLAIAALRCARDLDLPTPKAIGWRTRHWDGLTTLPEKLAPGPKCTTCGKQEAECWTQRPGIDDDHLFEPAQPVHR